VGITQRFSWINNMVYIIRYTRVTTIFARPYRDGGWRPTARASARGRAGFIMHTRGDEVTLGRGSRRRRRRPTECATDGCKSFLINSEIQIVHFFFTMISFRIIIIVHT